MSERVYLAHPYNGLSENKLEIERYIKIFIKADSTSKYSIVSPVHIFEKEYSEMPYLAGIELCFALIDSCDIVLFPEEIFLTSKGCCMEYGYARAKNKQIFFYNKDGVIV